MVNVKGVNRSIGRPRFQQDSPDGSLVEAMISYGNIEEKGADEPDPAYLHHSKEFELRNDNTAGDGLNGSISLDESDLRAVGAEKGDPVRVYAEANGRYIVYERDSYTDRAGVGMPKSHREKLGLNSENRTVKLWLAEADEPDGDSETEHTESDETQISLTGDEVQEEEYVLIPDNGPIKYHHVSSSDDSETKCGINFAGREHRRFTDPGDALEQCDDCAIRSSDDMTNKELVDWLGEQAGFEAEGSTPAYLSKGQLVALRDYILEIQDAQESDDTAEARLLSSPITGQS
jgi:hypothetical protein